MLPQPINKVSKSNSKVKPASVLLPHSLTAPKRPHPAEKDIIVKIKRNDSDEEEDNEKVTDFFGFSSSKIEANVPATVEMQSSFFQQTQFYNDVAGPSRPELKDDFIESKAKMKTISDEVGSIHFNKSFISACTKTDIR
jgi:hypothetical protein